MPYLYFPHRHIKIWLSSKPGSFLILENQLRLASMREMNPNDDLYFIYDSRLLTPTAISTMILFCKKHRIITKDVLIDVIPYCQTQEELNLLEKYTEQITHLDAGGNLAVASDVLRWLSPIYKLGTYTDFDVPVDTRRLPHCVMVKRPLLFNLGSLACTEELESISLNNDIMVVVNHEAALKTIQNIQKAIYYSCSVQTPPALTYFIDDFKANTKRLTSPKYLKRILSTHQTYQALSTLRSLGIGKSPQEVRHRVIELSKDNDSYSDYLLEPYQLEHIHLTSEAKVNYAADNMRKALESQNGRANPTYFSDLLAIKDDALLIQKLRTSFRMHLLKNSVMYSAGPAVVSFGAFQAGMLYTPEEIDEQITPFSFSHYDLTHGFSSQNGVPFHSSPDDYLTLKSAQPIGAINDLSWLEEGQDVLFARETKIEKATITLQRLYRKYKKSQDLSPKEEHPPTSTALQTMYSFRFFRCCNRDNRKPDKQEPPKNTTPQ